MPRLGDKDSMQDLAGRWIVLLDELTSIQGETLEAIKGYVTRAVDNYRGSYERKSRPHPRRCVFAGTTNDTSPLRQDTTGQRRFWCVDVDRVADTDELERVRDQLWAEAYQAWSLGETWWSRTEAHDELLRGVQASHVDTDPWIEPIAQWLETMVGFRFSTLTALERAVGMFKSNIGVKEQKRAAAVLRELGCVQLRSRTERMWSVTGVTCVDSYASHQSGQKDAEVTL
jgi:predicted P-loop ATPase